MLVVLQEKVANLGNVGDQVTVKPGYARNYLFPFQKAVMATPENIAEFEKHRAELERAAAEVLAKAKAQLKSLENLSVTIAVNASEEGKLFGSIAPRDVAEAITKEGVEIEKSAVDMPEGPIRQVGEYDIQIRLHADVVATVKIVVVPVEAAS